MKLQGTETIQLRRDFAPMRPFPGVCITTKAGAADTEGAYSLFELNMQPTGKVPALAFHEQESYVYGVSGTLEVCVGGKSWTVSPGDVVYIPKGIWFSIENVAEGKSLGVLFMNPGGIEDFFKAVDGHKASGGSTCDAIARLSKAHGVELGNVDVPISSKTSMSRTGEGLQEVVMGVNIELKSQGEVFGGRTTISEATLLPRQAVPLHIHHGESEGYYVVAGEFEFIALGEIHHVTAGSYAYFPRGVAHCHRNVGSTTGKLLTFLAPTGYEALIEEIVGAENLSIDQLDAIERKLEAEVLDAPIAYAS